MTAIETVRNAIQQARELFDLEKIWVPARAARILGIQAGVHSIEFLECLIGGEDEDRGSSSQDQ